MLLLCVTGLPLIFHDEIDDLLHDQVKPAFVAADTPEASVDQAIAGTLAKHPGQVVHFFIWDRDDPNAYLLSINRSFDVDPSTNRIVRIDAHTAAYLDSPDVTKRFTYIMLKLHTDMFAGLPGKLFLGLMGILFCVAIISGIVVYAASMRKLKFGTYRAERQRIVRWLNIHNLAGNLLVTWTLVVGATGVINTWADLVIRIWQFGQLAEMTAQYKDKPAPTHYSSVQAAVDTVKRAEPDMTPAFIAFPGSFFTSKNHYAIFMRGNSPLTARLLKPALIDVETSKLTDSRDLPWYVAMLLLSQPLHFGDYGGLLLKIVRAVLDVITILVLGTGLYLWLRRRRSRVSVGRMIAASAHDDELAAKSA
jgi:uncharacterized iron-regulated membrane protein